MVVASSFIYVWLRLKSESLWRAVIRLARHKYLTTEFGIGLALASTKVALYFWKRQSEVRTARRT